METLIIDDVRCFKGRIELPIKPITLLVGENSTGKSTVLALLRLVRTVAQRMSPNFNEEPFHLGSYENVARYHGGQGKRVKSFAVGMTFKKKSKVTLLAKFKDSQGHPSVFDWSLLSSRGSVRLQLADGSKWSASLRSTSSPEGGLTSFEVPQEFIGLPLSFLPFQLVRLKDGEMALVESEIPHKPRTSAETKWVREMDNILRPFSPHQVVTIAPVRSRPRRTYDPVMETPHPEGEHIPMLLARLKRQGTKDWGHLQAALHQFGVPAGIMDSLEVQLKGKAASDPFQLHVKVGDFPFNLVDVGYGVNQVLPILVSAIVAPAETTFLVQQPEVHLHPRAQAELGSFLVRMAAEDRKRFVVETHSDYLVDRVRMDVRDKRGLEAKDVVILFFQRQGDAVAVHPISIDSQGDLVNVPDGYRQFFLAEQRRFFGV